MKRLLVLCTTALAAIAIWAVAAPAGQESLSATITQRVKALEGKVKTLETTNKNLRAGLDCFKYIGITAYGNPAGGAGYLYRNPDGNVVVTTGLDVTEQGGTPSVNLATVEASCIRAARIPELTKAFSPAPKLR